MRFFKNIKIFLPILITMGFTQCSSSQKTMELQEKAPFNFEPVFAQEWTAGTEQGGKGLNVFISIKQLNTKKYTLKDFYFRGKKVVLEQNTTGKHSLYVARYTNAKPKEMVLHNDAEKEAENEPPTLQEKIPFELKNDEAVLSYEENGVLKYYKITGVKDKFPIFYPSVPPKKQ